MHRALHVEMTQMMFLLVLDVLIGYPLNLVQDESLNLEINTSMAVQDLVKDLKYFRTEKSKFDEKFKLVWLYCG